MTTTPTEMAPAPIVARPVSTTEPDLLLGFELEPFNVTDLDGTTNATLTIKAPDGGWTYDSLEAIKLPVDVIKNGCNLFLGEHWIGTSEL